jgi:hypothetical protein
MEIDTSKRCHSPLGYEAGYKKMLPLEIAYFMTVQNPIKDIPLQQRVQICKRNYHSKAYIIPKDSGLSLIY